MNKFNFDTIKEFDDHISSSIMGYDLLHSLIINVIDFYISEGTVYDLGCTTGSLLEKIKDQYSPKCIGYDISDKNFKSELDFLYKKDITEADLALDNADVILSVFTFQFIDIRKRQSIINSVYRNLSDTGAFIFCEKERSIYDHKFEFANYQNKRKRFSEQDILDKEKMIRTVMHPVSSSKNKEMLSIAGFEYDVFFKSLNYTGYICTK